MPALLFGSISTIADTSELQRDAFNAAFAAYGLDWNWGCDEYQTLLTSNGGQNRIADYARSRSEQVDANAVHDTKSKIFQERLANAPHSPRAGVVSTIAAAKQAGWNIGLVTTTSRANIAALLDNLPGLSETDFDVILDSASVEQPKPDPAAYRAALDSLGQQPADCLAVEDNLGGVASATAAGLRCVAFPNVNTAGHDFGDTPVIESLDLGRLEAIAGDS